jgi:hypothetical protein
MNDADLLCRLRELLSELEKTTTGLQHGKVEAATNAAIRAHTSLFFLLRELEQAGRARG